MEVLPAIATALGELFTETGEREASALLRKQRLDPGVLYGGKPASRGNRARVAEDPSAGRDGTSYREGDSSGGESEAASSAAESMAVEGDGEDAVAEADAASGDGDDSGDGSSDDDDDIGGGRRFPQYPCVLPAQSRHPRGGIEPASFFGSRVSAETPVFSVTLDPAATMRCRTGSLSRPAAPVLPVRWRELTDGSSYAPVASKMSLPLQVSSSTRTGRPRVSPFCFPTFSLGPEESVPLTS